MCDDEEDLMRLHTPYHPNLNLESGRVPGGRFGYVFCFLVFLCGGAFCK
jgi:hypothetical protein